MTNLVPEPNWSDVRQLEANEYATGGAGGNMNEQAKALAARTGYLDKYSPTPYRAGKVYALNERVQLDNGDIVKSTIANNTANPNSDMTGWVKTSDASQIFDESGKTQQEINNNTTQPWYSRSGGYELNSSVKLDNGFNVVSTINNNTTDPNIDMTSWLFNKDGYVTPQMFGAKGDGIQDDGPAFKRMIQYVVSKSYTPTVGSNRMLGIGVVIPSIVGGYRIATPQSLIPNLGTTRYVGLTFFGVGNPRIHFDYDVDDYLAYNNNQFLFTTFRNIDFSCSSNNAKFMYSTANGGAQDYYFDRCNWNGRWQKLFVLRGVNNNSEIGWQKCSITANIADVMLDVADSDQFLNYWFNQCKLWLYDGQCVRASAGGHIKFIACDWSGLQGNRDLCTSTKGKYLFELTGYTHARGVCDFRVIGGRFECKVNLAGNGINARILYCEWNQGNIDLSFDASSTIQSVYDSEYSIHIASGNTAGPILSIHDSFLIGKIKLDAGTSATQYRKVSNVTNTTFGGGTALTKPSDFIEITRYASGQAGAAAIRLAGCRSLQAYYDSTANKLTAWDLTIGNRFSVHADQRRNVAVFQGGVASGVPLSNSKAYLQLPPNSTILSIQILCDGGGSSTLDCIWTVVDDASSTELLLSAAHKMNQRWIEKTDLPFFTASGLIYLYDKAALNLTTPYSGFKCYVEFIC